MLVENVGEEGEKLLSVTVTSPKETNLNIPDNLSSTNSFGDKNQKTSYYVRDKFQPLKQHQNNIERLLLQFQEQQQQFTDVIFSHHLGGTAAERSSRSFKNDSESKAKEVSMETIRKLKMTFASIEEIDRLKRESNVYKQTQRNQLGVAKSGGGDHHKRYGKMNWIDLFNIGNVMLMRG